MKKKTEKERVWESLVESLAIYLAMEGWQALVVSSPRIQHGAGDNEFNYEFCCRLTAKPPADKTGKDPLSTTFPVVLDDPN